MIFSEQLNQLAARAESALAPFFAEIDRISFENTQKVMDAFRDHRATPAIPV